MQSPSHQMGTSITGCLRDVPYCYATNCDLAGRGEIAYPDGLSPRKTSSRDSGAAIAGHVLLHKASSGAALGFSAPAQTRRCTVCIAVIEADTIEPYWGSWGLC